MSLNPNIHTSMDNDQNQYVFELDLESSSLELDIKSCIHDWTEYVGFTDIYLFCKKCDVKQC